MPKITLGVKVSRAVGAHALFSYTAQGTLLPSKFQIVPWARKNQVAEDIDQQVTKRHSGWIEQATQGHGKHDEPSI